MKIDIANFRLMIKKDGVDDIELELYSKAMKIVQNAPINSGTETVSIRTSKVVQRK
jgi:hypothetical protein